MFRKQIAAVGAAILVAMPAAASDLNQSSAPGMMFFVSVPLDARTPKQQMPALGLSFQGERAYQRVVVDTRMFQAVDRLGFGPLGGIEAKWIIGGVVIAGAGVAVASRDKKTTESHQQQQQQQIQQQQMQQQNGGGNGTVPCPATC